MLDLSTIDFKGKITYLPLQSNSTPSYTYKYQKESSKAASLNSRGTDTSLMTAATVATFLLLALIASAFLL